MNKKILLSCSLLTFLLTSYPSISTVQATQTFLIGQSIWKPFSSQEGRFKVLFPGTPIQQKENVRTQQGSFVVNSFLVPRENEALYGVGYTDFPKNISPSFNEINQLVRELSSKDTQAAGVKLVSQRDLRLGNFSGREIKVQFAEKFIMRWRFYLVNKRVYQLLVFTDKEASLTKSIDGFLNSFQLLNNPTAPEKPVNNSTAPQTPLNNPTPPQKPAIEELNAELKQAVCAQNWTQAIKIVNRMIAIAPSPETRTQLETYRTQLQGLANSSSKIPPELLTGCATGK